jgi:hypothetical protein
VSSQPVREAAGYSLFMVSLTEAGSSLAASTGGAILIVLVLLVVFVGMAYGLSRRGSGVDAHPRHGREGDDADEAPGADRPGGDVSDARLRDY